MKVEIENAQRIDDMFIHIEKTKQIQEGLL